MKIADIVYSTPSQVDKMPRFDLTSPPTKPWAILQPLAWLLSFPEVIKVGAKVRKHNMVGIKPPYILLCNHNSFLDFKVATKAFFPHRANYTVAIDGFINREGIMRKVGCFGKRKFIADPSIVKTIKHSLYKNKVICSIYPEARYSLVGCSTRLPESLGKLVKMFPDVPVVTLICRGHHLQQPVWNLKKRKVKTSADLSLLFAKNTTQNLSVEEINQKIKEAFVYDDFKYQFDNHILIKEPFRAEGLEAMLYKCPHCFAEEKMVGVKNQLICQNCHKTYDLLENGRLQAKEGTTEFPHIPDWFNWERQEVKKEIESGKYRFEGRVYIDSLPNSTGFYRFGEGKLIHDYQGFHLSGAWGEEKLELHKTPLENYSVHVEYNYFGKGHGVSFSTLKDTYYLFSENKKWNVTKIHFATEELYDYTLNQKKR